MEALSIAVTAPACPLARGSKSTFDILRALYFQGLKLHPQDACCGLRLLKRSELTLLDSMNTAMRESLGTISLSSSSRLSAKSGEKAQSRDVSSRPRQAGDKPGSDRIATERHDNRNRTGCVA